MQISINSKTTLWLSACFCSAWLFAAQSKAEDFMSPLWSRVAVPDLVRTRTGGSPDLMDSSRAGVVFLNNQTLIAFAVDQVGGHLSSRISPDISSQFLLHLNLLDAISGKLEFTKDLGTRVHDQQVEATNGGLLVRTGQIVRLFTPDFARSRDLTPTSGVDGFLRTSVSATGNTILLNRTNQRLNISDLDVFDAITLAPKQSWRESPPLYSNYAISDQGIAASSADLHYVVAAGFKDKKWNVVADNSKSNCLLAAPTLSTDGSLIVQQCEDLSVLAVAGGSYSLGSLGGIKSKKTAVAREGRFVALTLDTTDIEKHLFKESRRRITETRVAIFDLTLKKRILTVQVDPLPKNDYDFALSPDGSKLAILNDSRVSLYAVPITPPGHISSMRDAVP